jgi:hypothetical protein
MTHRRMVRCKNFSPSEGRCKCGCGLESGDDIILRVQAFILMLERIHDAPVQFRITGPARCKQHNADENGARDSRHLPKPEDGCGDALDGTFWTKPAGKSWQLLDCRKVAAEAVTSCLFGGVGVRKYKYTRIHLDGRPGLPVVEW